MEFLVSVGMVEESWVFVRDFVCDGLCVCFGVGLYYGVWMDVYVLIIKWVFYISIVSYFWFIFD